MERIKKAVEQARLERAGKTPLPRGAGKEAKSAAVAEVGEIAYSQTRQIDVSPSLSERHRLIGTLNDEAAEGAYRVLRTQVLQRMKENDWSTLAITSSSPGEGKTLTAVNLAISLAREVSYTVLLVDLDLRKQGLHEYFGYTPELSLVDYLQHDTPLSEILVKPNIDKLVLLPSVGPVENSSELLTSPKMAALVQELKSRYPSRLVLFDLPPLLVADDAFAFLPNTDATLLVVEDGKTTKQELRRSHELLENRALLGTVLNRCTEAVYAYG